MNFFARKRLFALVIACLMLLSTCAAFAEQAMVMEKAVVYASAKTSSNKLGTLKAGTQLEVVAEQNGWSKVELNGNVGYMKSNALAEYKTYDDVDGYTTKSTAMYKSFSTSSKKLGTIAKNEKVTVSAIAGKWARISYKDQVGFVLAANLTNKAPAVQEEKTETFDSYTAYANADNTKVYNAKGKAIGTVGVNTKVTVIAEKDGVCQVKRDGKTAYMYKKNLSTSEVKVEEEKTESSIVEISPTTFYVKNDNAKVYNSKGKVTGKLALNTAVTVSAYNGDLAKISYSGKTGIMYKSDLSSSKIEEEKSSVVEISPTTFYVKNDNAKVYNSKGKVTGKLALNTAVTVSAYNGDLAKISYSGKTGIMYKSDLSSTKIEEEKNDVVEISPTTYYVKNDNAKVLDADGDTIAKLSINTAVTVTAYNDEYAKVTNGSTVGMMKKSDLSSTKVETESSLTLQYGDKGEAVEKVQARLKELGYFSGTVGGNYLDLTRAAVVAFQAAAGLDSTGVCDEKTLTKMFSDSAPKKEAEKETSKEESSSGSSGYSTATPAKGTAKAMDWWTSDIQKIFSRGTVATVTDVSTGIAWYEKRTGGTNHADVQPLTAADTNSMKKAVGSWSWNRRAIFVTINGVNYAASMNAMPHGSGSITTNNFNGHHCIHFTNSRTHGSNSVCSLHQAAIKKAANATL